MHISYNGKTGKFSIEDISKPLLQEIVKELDRTDTTPELRAGLYDIRDSIETMGVATLDENMEYVWPKEPLPF